MKSWSKCRTCDIEITTENQEEDRKFFLDHFHKGRLNFVSKLLEL